MEEFAIGLAQDLFGVQFPGLQPNVIGADVQGDALQIASGVRAQFKPIGSRPKVVWQTQRVQLDDDVPLGQLVYRGFKAIELRDDFLI